MYTTKQVVEKVQATIQTYLEEFEKTKNEDVEELIAALNKIGCTHIMACTCIDTAKTIAQSAVTLYRFKQKERG